MSSKAERTKQFIIEKTAPVFNAKGYAGTSINDLIDATGLTKGSIYGNFENKDEVALAVFDYNFECIYLYIKNKMAAHNSVINKLRVYTDVYRNYFKIPFLRAGCPILNTSTEADDTHPLLRDKANKAIGIWKDSIERLLKYGIKTKELKPDINVNEFVIVLVSLIEGGVMQAKISGKIQPLSVSMDHLDKMILALKK
jgi:TetR/AcrR family transcriptional regulator, transcriptional repressor for nem operon